MQERSILALMAFWILVAPASVLAHTPNTLTVIVHELTHDPDVVSIVVNDTVQYYIADDRENVSHYIGFDHNEDGDYEDEGEFGSGPLNHTCDWDNDSGCRRAWIFKVNDTSLIGTHNLVDYTNTGESHFITLIVDPDLDTHGTSSGNAPPIGECLGACNETSLELSNVASSTESNHSNLLLGGGIMLTGLALLILVSSIMDHRKIRTGPVSQQQGEDE